MSEQVVVLDSDHGRVVAVDSAYDTQAANRGRDVVVNASYSGVLPARFVGQHAPRGAIGVDCGVGPEGAGIAGLWYLEGLGLPAATADIATVRLGDGVDMYETARVSRVNALAEGCGVLAGMRVAEAARLLLDVDPPPAAADEITRRQVMVELAGGRQIVCLDSIAFGTQEDRGLNVLCTAGHTGRSAVPYLRRVAPWGFICSDGGGGKDRSGVLGLDLVQADGLAGATVDARTARMGDGRSTYEDGVISARNAQAAERGVEIGQPAREAARLLLGPEAATPGRDEA